MGGKRLGGIVSQNKQVDTVAAKDDLLKEEGEVGLPKCDQTAPLPPPSSPSPPLPSPPLPSPPLPSGSLQDLPPDALLASTLPQFASQMRPYLWVEFPSATASQINAIIHSKWKALKASSLTMLSRSYIATLPESKGSCSKLVSAYILDLPDLLNLPNPLDLPDPLDLRDLGQRE